MNDIADSSSPSAEGDAVRVLLRRVGAVFALSVRRLTRSKFLYANLFLASLPIIVALLWLTKGMTGNIMGNINEAHDLYQTLLRTVYLQFIVFFVANLFGFAVMRQELDDHTLHYLLLEPVDRWVLILGKLVACLVLASVICISSLWITYFLLTVPAVGVKAVMVDLFREGRLVGMLKESLVICLGLLAYTSVAMLMGSLFKSAIYAVVLIAWEAGLSYLPASMKLWTVVHYLHSLLPERLGASTKLFALLGEPAPVWLCWLVIVGVSTFFVSLCVGLFHFKECLYTES